MHRAVVSKGRVRLLSTSTLANVQGSGIGPRRALTRIPADNWLASEEALAARGMLRFGAANAAKIRMYFLPTHSEAGITQRIRKRSTMRSPDNPIKVGNEALVDATPGGGSKEWCKTSVASAGVVLQRRMPFCALLCTAGDAVHNPAGHGGISRGSVIFCPVNIELSTLLHLAGGGIAVQGTIDTPGGRANCSGAGLLLQAAAPLGAHLPAVHALQVMLGLAC